MRGGDREGGRGSGGGAGIKIVTNRTSGILNPRLRWNNQKLLVHRIANVAILQKAKLRGSSS